MKKRIVTLQRYIYKRPQNQTSSVVIDRIMKENRKEPLTRAEWNALLIPASSNPDPELFKWLLDEGATLNENGDVVVKMIIGSRDDRLDMMIKRVALLELVIAYTDEYESLLDIALLNACWFNNLYVVEFLVKKGRNLLKENESGKTPFECAQLYAARTGDETLHTILLKYLETKVWMIESVSLYSYKDILGNDVYRVGISND